MERDKSDQTKTNRKEGAKWLPIAVSIFVLLAAINTGIIFNLTQQINHLEQDIGFMPTLEVLEDKIDNYFEQVGTPEPPKEIVPNEDPTNF